MSGASQTVLLVVFELATSIWTGGLITIAIVARVSARTVGRAERVAFFRSLGKVYGMVGTAALVVALATGAGLLSNRSWTGTLVATVALAAVLLLALAAGVVQARRMSALRRRSMAEPSDTALAGQVTGGARQAGALRGAIALLTLVLVVLGSVLATSH
ncbi:MAG: DUF4149 domain-containing protein [Jatrophihabitantaceae bacterium]